MISRRLVSLGLVVAGALALGCPRRAAPAPAPPDDDVRTRVGVERADTRRTEGRASGWDGVVFPPVYARAVLPDYPPEAERARVGPVRVAVDFVVRADGAVDRPRATVDGDPPFEDRFRQVCLEVVPRWAFAPAWRLGRPEDAEPAVVPVDHRGRLVFTFDLEVGSRVGVSFDD